MANTITNQDDIIDSREIIDRIEELGDELLACFNEQQETEGFTVSDESEEIYQADSVADGLFQNWLKDCRIEEAEEYKALAELANQGQSESSDWTYGETLIRRSHFVDYISELIHDCYEMPKELTSGDWPFRHITIDYEAAANEAEQDYSSVDFDGVEYLIRSC
jgi:hypothetical protein